MIDNKKVKDNHQGGIERIKMKKGDLKTGQSGKLKSYKHNSERSKAPLTPRKA